MHILCLERLMHTHVVFVPTMSGTSFHTHQSLQLMCTLTEETAWHSMWVTGRYHNFEYVSAGSAVRLEVSSISALAVVPGVEVITRTHIGRCFPWGKRHSQKMAKMSCKDPCCCNHVWELITYQTRSGQKLGSARPGSTASLMPALLTLPISVWRSRLC